MQAAKLSQQQRLVHHTSFFADRWSRSNQQQPATAGAGSSLPVGAGDVARIATSEAAAPAGSDTASQQGNSAGCGTVCLKSLGEDTAALCNWTSKCGARTSRGHRTGSSTASNAQRVTDRVMVLLQPFSLGPGVLLLSFLLLQEVLTGDKKRVGMHMQDHLFRLLAPRTNMLAPLVVVFLTISTRECC